MITAVDTNVLFDLIDGQSALVSEEAAMALSQSAVAGSLVLSTVAYAELAPSFANRQLLEDFLEEIGMRVQTSSLDEAFAAGKLFAEHKRINGRRGRILTDFFVGAHAILHADRLLTRDQRFYQLAFEQLQVVSPRDLLQRPS